MFAHALIVEDDLLADRGAEVQAAALASLMQGSAQRPLAPPAQLALLVAWFGLGLLALRRGASATGTADATWNPNASAAVNALAVSSDTLYVGVLFTTIGGQTRSRLAAISLTSNTTGTAVVLEAARAAGAHVIVASSSSVYGANPELPKHEGLVPRPVSPYAATKLATETYALAWGHSYGMAVLAFRFFNVFGPLQPAGHAYAAVIPAFIDAALRGDALTVHGDGTQSRDYVYVGDVARAVLAAVVRDVSGVLNIGTGVATSVSVGRQNFTPRCFAFASALRAVCLWSGSTSDLPVLPPLASLNV